MVDPVRAIDVVFCCLYRQTNLVAIFEPDAGCCVCALASV